MENDMEEVRFLIEEFPDQIADQVFPMFYASWSIRARMRAAEGRTSIELCASAPPPGHSAGYDPQILRDLLVRRGRGTREHDPRPQRQRLRGLRSPDPLGQLLPLAIGQHHIGFRPSRTLAVT